MKTIRLLPQTLIQTALKDAEKALKADKGDRVLSDGEVAKLPAALRGVVDDFRAAGNARVETGDILGLLKSSLEAGLAQSLSKGELVAHELSADLGALLAYSSVGVQVQKALAERAMEAPADFSSAAQEAQVALAEADLSVQTQVRAMKELSRAAQLAKSEAPDQALLLDGIAKDRAKIVRTVVDSTVKGAEQALKGAPNDVAAKQQLAAALTAAIDVHTAVNPKSARVKTLRAQLSKLDVQAPRTQAAQPFFARFLENQNRGGPRQVEEPGMMVTMKYPSDNEDGGDIMTTMKAPSDHEDGGFNGGGMGGGAVTEKFPSDAEDGGAGQHDDGGVMTTMKHPSDNEDGGVGAPDDGGGVVTTRKFPSDDEDGGVDAKDGGVAVTKKYPSDAEDGGVDGGGETFTTLKYPSDNEDAGDGGDVDGGVMVTMKFPSDNEDGGGVGDDGGMYVTMKYPSDNEDGGGDVTGPAPIVGVPGDVPAGGKAAEVSGEVLKAAWNGKGGIQDRIAELEDLLTRARFSPEGLAEKQAEIAGLKAMLEGGKWMETRLSEIQHHFMVALMTPEASQALTLEQDVLKNLLAAVKVGYAYTAETVGARPDRSEGEDVAVRALLIAYDGKDALEARVTEIDNLLMAGLFDEGGLRRIQAERAVVKALVHGGPTLHTELSSAQEALRNFGGTPAEAQKLQTQADALLIALEAERAVLNHGAAPVPLHA